MMRRMLVLTAALLLAPAAAVAQEADTADADPPAPIAQEDLEWVEIVPGVDFAATHGQWAEGAHGKFVRFQPGAAAPLHRHSSAYRGVIIQGRLTNPYPGEEAVEMGPGDYWHVPAGMAHSNECVSDEPCLFYTYGDAPWDVTMVED